MSINLFLEAKCKIVSLDGMNEKNYVDAIELIQTPTVVTQEINSLSGNKNKFKAYCRLMNPSREHKKEVSEFLKFHGDNAHFFIG